MEFCNTHVHQPMDKSAEDYSGAIESMTTLNNRRWHNEVTLLFLDCMHAYKDEVHIPFKRREIMKKVAVQMAERKYNFSLDELLKKWNNLIQTYRKIKDKVLKGTGGVPHNWPYYNIMCEIVQRAESLPNITQYASSSLGERKVSSNVLQNKTELELSVVTNVQPNQTPSKSGSSESPILLQRGSLQQTPQNRTKKNARRFDEQDFKENDSKRTKLLESFVEYSKTKDNVKNEEILAELKKMNYILDSNLKSINMTLNSNFTTLNTNINNLCQAFKSFIEK